jgi:transposase
VIQLSAGTKIWIAAGVTDLRRGFDGLSAQVQTVLQQQPFSGHVFIFRGRRGDIVKCLWFDGDGLCLFAKRLEKGRFIWPQATEGTVSLSRAQLSMLLEGIDWRRPQRTWTPEIAVCVTMKILLCSCAFRCCCISTVQMAYSTHVSCSAARSGCARS